MKSGIFGRPGAALAGPPALPLTVLWAGPGPASRKVSPARPANRALPSEVDQGLKHGSKLAQAAADFTPEREYYLVRGPWPPAFSRVTRRAPTPGPIAI